MQTAFPIPPRQDRSRRTLERILDATEKLLEDTLFDDLTIDQIITAAGTSTGSFYARFPSKQSLLPALYDRYCESARQALDSTDLASHKSLESLVHAAVSSQVKRIRGRRGLMRTLVLCERRRPGILGDAPAISREMNDRWVEAFRPHFGAINSSDPERMVLWGMYFVHAVLRERVLFPQAPHASTIPLPAKVLVEELTALLVRYLRG